MAEARILGSASAVQEHNLPISPTLMIGLGGTGMEVLIRLRHAFYMHHGISGFPCMSYFWLDTDRNAQSNLVPHLTRSLPSIRFNEEEFLDLSIDETDFVSIQRNPNANKHIFSWLDSKVFKMGSVIDGAAQKRQVGRLAFFQQYSRIQESLINKINSISNAEIEKVMRLPSANAGVSGIHGANDETGFGFSDFRVDRLNVILVSSIAGGTGAGSFLDMAFLLRHLSRINDWPSLNITGYLVLPTNFSDKPQGGEGEVIYANAMASLRELEFYSSRKDLGIEDIDDSNMEFTSSHDYQVQWDANKEPLRIVGPPFNLCYLIDNTTDKSAPLGDKNCDELYSMMAQRLFMEFDTGGFSTKLKSVGSNMSNFLKQDLKMEYKDNKGEKIHESIFSQRFSSMGLTRVYLPEDRIRKACSLKFAGDLVSKWLKHNSTKDLSNEFRKKILENDRGLILNDIMAQLLRHGDKDWGMELRNNVNRIHDNLRNEINGANRVSSQLVNGWKKLDRYFVKKEGVAPEDWGEARREIIQNTDKVMDSLVDSLKTFTRTWCDDFSKGIRQAYELLEELAGILAKKADATKSRAKQLANETARVKKEVSRVKQMIQDEETHKFPRQKRSLHVLSDYGCELLGDYFKKLADVIALEQASEVFLSLQKWLGMGPRQDADTQTTTSGSGFLQHLDTLIRQLENLHASTETGLQEADYGEKRIASFPLYREGDYKSFYRISKPGTDQEINPVEELPRFQRGLFKKTGIGNLMDLTDFFAEKGESSFELELNTLASQYFSPNENRVVINLRDYLTQKSKSELDAIAERLFKWGLPWTKYQRSNAQFKGKDIMLIGVNKKLQENAAINSLITKLESLASNANISRKEILDCPTDSIYVFTDVAALPLYSINQFGLYEEAYISQIGKGESERHTNKHFHLFTGIRPFEGDEATLHHECVSIMTRAVVLDVVTVEKEINSGSSHLEFSFEHGDHVPVVDIPLRHWDNALTVLKRKPDYRDYLDNLCRDLEMEMVDATKRKYLAVLVDNRIEGGTFTEKRYNYGGNIETVTNAETIALKRIIDSLSSELELSGAEVNALHAELKSGFTEFTYVVEDNQMRLRILRNR